MLKRNGWTRSRIALREWLPVIVLMCCTFVFNTSEFIPIGLLSDIAADFGITEARAGLLITVYAWVVALVSLPLMLAVARMECRRLMLGVLGLFIASHVLSGLSSSYAMLMASRIGVACAHAVFWSIVSPLAVRVAPKGAQSAALGLIITGTSIAMIVGLPLGRVIGLYVGWRTTFFFIAAVAAAVWLFLAAIFPRVPSRDTISLRKVPSLLGNPALVGVYVLTVLMVTGHYTGYSYIEPFLAQVAGLDNDWITWVLTAFGLVGIVGSLWFSRDYEKRPYAFMRFAVVGIAFFLLLLRLSAFGHFPVVALCICWGLAITIFNLVFQSEIIRLAPGDGDRHVRLFGDLQRRNRCRGTRRRIRLYARFDCPDRLCRGCDRIVGGALLLGAVGAVIEKEPGLISNEEPETPCHRRGGRALCLSGCRPERSDQRCKLVGSYSACCFPLGSRGLKKPLPDFL